MDLVDDRARMAAGPKAEREDIGGGRLAPPASGTLSFIVARRAMPSPASSRVCLATMKSCDSSKVAR